MQVKLNGVYETKMVGPAKLTDVFMSLFTKKKVYQFESVEDKMIFHVREEELIEELS
jgi:hypothetical protein